MRKFPRSRAHIFGYLSITRHPYHLRAWNRLPPDPSVFISNLALCNYRLLSVLTFVRMKFVSLFVEAFLSFSFQDRAFKNVRCYSRVDSPIKSSYGQCSPNIISDNFYINMLSFQNETHSCKNGQNGF